MVWFWRLHPILVSLIILVVNFGVLLILRSLERGYLYWPEDNKTVLVGDGVLLPLYAGSTSWLLRNDPIIRSRLFRDYKWHLGVIGLAIIVSVAIEIMVVMDGHWGLFREPTVSKTYHRFVFIALFYLLVSALPLIYRRRQQVWIAGLASLSLTIFISIAWWEMHPMAQESAQVTVQKFGGEF
jgi:hypothetical protein